MLRIVRHTSLVSTSPFLLTSHHQSQNASLTSAFHPSIPKCAHTIVNPHLVSAFCSKSLSHSSNHGTFRPLVRAKSFSGEGAGGSAGYSEAENGVGEDGEEFGIGTEALESFFRLSAGRWAGHFNQHELTGGKLQEIATVVTSSFSGRKDLSSLQQTLSIKRAELKTSEGVGEEGEGDSAWVEISLPEVNKFSAGRSQQIGVFGDGGAFAVSHITAEVLEKILWVGVVGKEVGDEEEITFPEESGLPSRRPALVSEACLYAPAGGGSSERRRAFFVLDPRGVMDFLGIFMECEEDASPQQLESVDTTSTATMKEVDWKGEVGKMLGVWEGFAVRQRSGLYGSTTAQEDVTTRIDLEPDGSIVMDATHVSGGRSRRQVVSKGRLERGLIKFNGALQTTLVGDGLSLTYPSVVPRGHAFFFEFAWIFETGKRKRIIRTYDSDGLVVSTTLVSETLKR